MKVSNFAHLLGAELGTFRGCVLTMNFHLMIIFIITILISYSTNFFFKFSLPGTNLAGVQQFGGHNYYFSWLDEDARVRFLFASPANGENIYSLFACSYSLIYSSNVSIHQFER